ncbi:Heat-inducible transcription repressor HrcA [Gossypium australe]|uniref:Heat-inducible transcription repressor HrcA n=2 Tax=Gossypium TaxID=3633 RepID=A0A5B6UGV7_9ROSI|nr:Heat-inducible transcription repressor HrcA [Gossypium australe]
MIFLHNQVLLGLLFLRNQQMEFIFSGYALRGTVEIVVTSKTRNMLEALIREGSFKWLLSKRSSFAEEVEELQRSPSAGRNWIPELSPVANIVVRRCSKILETSSNELLESFNAEASDSVKSQHARNFLEYCCFRALALSTRVMGHLADKKFRRLTFDMMVAWEAPASASECLVNLDDDLSVGVEAFSRIAPAVPIIANVIICENLFNVLTISTDGRLHFSVYDKYLNGLERALATILGRTKIVCPVKATGTSAESFCKKGRVIKRMKSQSESSLLSAVRQSRGEKILEVDGTVTTQPVLEHVGVSTWPGRLILTDHALYFEALKVVSYDKPKRYDLSNDLKQIVKPELTGPWGTRLFDKAVLYKSISISEPVVMEFPELKGHTRRDYWLAIIREILYVHKFINKYHVTGVEKDDALSKAILGILRVQVIQEISSSNPVQFESLLMFNLCDQLPGGYFILETLAKMSKSRELDRGNNLVAGGGMYSISALAMVSNLGFVFGSSSSNPSEAGLLVGEVVVGELSLLEKAVKESRDDYKRVVLAQETVAGVKVDGIDTNLAVMKELLLPVLEVGKGLLSLVYWDDPPKSLMFCLIFTFIIFRGWVGYALALMVLFFAIFMVLTRFFNQGRPVDEIKIIAPPPMNTMEQLLAVQNAVSQFEQLIQDGNIILLKFRALLLSVFPQASEKVAASLLLTALMVALLPGKYMFLLIFLEIFTRYSPVRKASTERWMRRLREWWFSIPAAPVVLEREKEDKKKK